MKCIECPYKILGAEFAEFMGKKITELGCTLKYVYRIFYKGNGECSLTYDEISKINELTNDVLLPQVPIEAWLGERFLECMELKRKEAVERLNEYLKELKEKGR